MTQDLKNRVLENKVLTHDERTEIIRDLEKLDKIEHVVSAYSDSLEYQIRKAVQEIESLRHIISLSNSAAYYNEAIDDVLEVIAEHVHLDFKNNSLFLSNYII